MMLNHQLKYTAGGQNASTIGRQMTKIRADSSTKQIRATTNTFLNAENFTYSNGVLKSKEKFITKEKPRTTVSSKIGNYMVSENIFNLIESRAKA